MSWIVKLGKKGKKIVKKIITPAEKHYVGYTRRIERVKTGERICAMTFDDGPMGLPASPDRFEGKTLTDVLLDTLAQYGAKAASTSSATRARTTPTRRASSAARRGAASNSTTTPISTATTRAEPCTTTA